MRESDTLVFPRPCLSMLSWLSWHTVSPCNDFMRLTEQQWIKKTMSWCLGLGGWTCMQIYKAWDLDAKDSGFGPVSYQQSMSVALKTTFSKPATLAPKSRSHRLLSHWTKKPTNTHSHLAFVFCQWERVQSAFTPRSDDSAVVRGMLLAHPLWFWWKHDTRVDPQVFTLFPAQRYDECWRSGCWHVNSFSPPLSLFRRCWVWTREW